jgi:hypothetical protein
MKYKKLILLAFLPTLGLMEGCNPNEPFAPFTKTDVRIVSGISYETKKLIAVDPDTGKLLNSCGPLETIDLLKESYDLPQQLSKKPIPTGCNVKFVINQNTNPLLDSALKASLTPISGQVVKDGKLVDAKYVVVVKALYPGSHCEADSSSGVLIANCPRHR